MNPQTINVLLIEDNSDYAELVEQWIAPPTEHEQFRLQWTDSLAQGLQRVGQADIVLLDLGLPDSDGMPTFLTVRDHGAGVPVLVLSAADNEALALRAIQEGAEDYLVKSTCTRDQLLRAMRYALLRHGAQRRTAPGSKPGSRVLGVLGAKGGAGATAVACCLADELSNHSTGRVLLADFDFHCGSVAFVMGVEPKYTTLEAFDNAEDLDSDCWQSIVINRGGLDILASPASLGASEPSVAAARGVLKRVKPLYRWSILDLGRPNGFPREMLDSVDEVLIVTTPEIPALYETKRLIDASIRAGMETGRFRLVVNRANSHAVSARDLKSMFGVEVEAAIPEAPAELRQAFLEHRLPLPSGKFGKEVARLARKIAGLPEPPPKRVLSELLGMGRSRKTVEANPGA